MPSFSPAPGIVPSTQSFGSGNVGSVTAAVQGTKGAWVQLIAASTFLATQIQFSMFNNQAVTFQFDLGTGAAAAEVVKIADITVYGGSSPMFSCLFSFPSGTRFAYRIANMTSAVALAGFGGIVILG